MNKYETIGKVMNSNKVPKKDKVCETKMVLKGYYTSGQLVWRWEEE